MKNLFNLSKIRLFAIVALIAIIGFSIIACRSTKSGGGSSGDTTRYTIFNNVIVFNADFQTGFGVPTPPVLKVVYPAKSKTEIQSWLDSNYSRFKSTGVPYSGVDSALQAYVSTGHISSGLKSQILDGLHSNGWTAIGIGISYDATSATIMAVFKE